MTFVIGWLGWGLMSFAIGYQFGWPAGAFMTGAGLFLWSFLAAKAAAGR